MRPVVGGIIRVCMTVSFYRQWFGVLRRGYLLPVERAAREAWLLRRIDDRYRGAGRKLLESLERERAGTGIMESRYG